MPGQRRTPRGREARGASHFACAATARAAAGTSATGRPPPGKTPLGARPGRRFQRRRARARTVRPWPVPGRQAAQLAAGPLRRGKRDRLIHYAGFSVRLPGSRWCEWSEPGRWRLSGPQGSTADAAGSDLPCGCSRVGFRGPDMVGKMSAGVETRIRTVITRFPCHVASCQWPKPRQPHDAWHGHQHQGGTHAQHGSQGHDRTRLCSWLPCLRLGPGRNHAHGPEAGRFGGDPGPRPQPGKTDVTRAACQRPSCGPRWWPGKSPTPRVG